LQEHRIYPLAIRWFAEGRLRLGDGGVWFDGHLLEAPLLVDGTADAA
jgi:phosphoribosylglycinamide formyltransferase-1